MAWASFYGEVLEVSDEEAEGMHAFVLGREMDSESAPLGFAFPHPMAGDAWRRGYAMAALEIADRQLLI